MLADPQKFTSRKRYHRADFRDSLNFVYYEREIYRGYFREKMTLPKKVQSLKTLCITAFSRFIKFCIYEGNMGLRDV